MPGVITYNQRSIEKELFTLQRSDLMFIPDLLSIAVIPLKPTAIRKLNHPNLE